MTPLELKRKNGEITEEEYQARVKHQVESEQKRKLHEEKWEKEAAKEDRRREADVSGYYRTHLQNLIGVRHSYEATFVRKGFVPKNEDRGQFLSFLFRDVKHDGKIVAEHLWVDSFTYPSGWFFDDRDNSGTRISFTAIAEKYIKRNPFSFIGISQSTTLIQMENVRIIGRDVQEKP